MNTVIAKVIAFELGLLIAILTWMAATDIPKSSPNHAADPKPVAQQAFATVSPALQAEARDFPAGDDPVEEEETAPLVEDEPLQTAQTDAQDYAQTYAQETAPEAYVDSGYGDYAPIEDPNNYIGDYPEPVLYGPDCYAPSTYSIVTVPAPQVVVRSHSHSSGRRHQIMRPRHRSRGPIVRHMRPRSHSRQAQAGGRRPGTRRPMPPRNRGGAPSRQAIHRQLSHSNHMSRVASSR